MQRQPGGASQIRRSSPRGWCSPGMPGQCTLPGSSKCPFLSCWEERGALNAAPRYQQIRDAASREPFFQFPRTGFCLSIGDVLSLPMNNGSTDTLGIIAGNRSLPLLFARQARTMGVKRLVAVAFEGETDPDLAKWVDEVIWLKVGRLSQLISTFVERGVRQCVMV